MREQRGTACRFCGQVQAPTGRAYCSAICEVQARRTGAVDNDQLAAATWRCQGCAYGGALFTPGEPCPKCGKKSHRLRYHPMLGWTAKK